MRFQRILSNPAPIDETGAGEDDDIVSISRKDLEELKARVAAMESASGGDARDIEVAVHLADRTPLNDALEFDVASTNQDPSRMDLERAYRLAILERELATVLAGRPLVPGTAKQLIKLWRDDFDVYEDDGTFKVAARDGRSVSQAVADWLSSPEYSHFQVASARGGTGAAGLGGSPAAQTTRSGILGDEIVRRWKESTPRPNPSSGRSGWGRPR